MAAGVYCDVTRYDFLPASNRCVDPSTGLDAPAGTLITVDNSGQIVARMLGGMDAFAIHANARLCSVSAVTGPFPVTIGRLGAAVALAWADYGGPYDVRYSTINPYFTPLSGDQQGLPVPMTNAATLAGQLGDVSTQHYYVVQVTTCPATRVNSARVGEFEFELAPGN